ncbi:phage tail tape measure protein [Fusobacterium periodonticum]|uniref:Phage tail tape measure protein, TP901 family, core region n=1 Tax=Fusobacterium periodonticum 1_1_41FAA TaxID=469621 RepID=D6LHL3_9FUSO|nr:phage tail tape measure protein [Fusobacterium periodonticum]EFG27889.1 phage tail tape measure protein, TP901 family [Fusobacterium periodonticum 1_1_41FAA]
MAKRMDLIMKVQGLIDKSLPGNLKKLANEVKNLRAERQKMEKAQKTLKAQKELNKEITANVAKYRKLRNELKALDEIKKRNVNLTEAEKKKYESLTKKAKALETTIKSQSKSFQKYGMELKKLKIPFDNLQSEIDQTIRKEKELIAQQKIVAKSQGFFKGAKDKVKTGMKVAAVATVGAAIGIGTSSAKEYLEFDKQMIKVKALTGATAQEYEALKKKAMEVGKTTIFTSEEAAAGMEKFALAGFKPKEIISAIPPIFDLATASGEDFIMISDMISDNMTAFNIGIDDVGHASDILANTMSRSNTNIQMLGEAFKYVSSSANNLNIDLSTTSAAIGLMGDQAIKSGQAGRDLKQAFSKIADAGVQKKLQKLGVNVKDAKGEFIGLVDFVRQLEKVTKMSGIDKQAFLKDLFGDQGSLAMNKLLTATKEVNGVMYEGADALAEFAKENENATGKAKEMAQTILDSDSGKWALVESAISDVKLKIGKAIFSSGGTQLMDTVMSWLNELSNVLDGNLNESEANKFWQSFIENGKMALNSIKNIGIVLWNVFKVLNTIGIDNILVFVTVFTATSKVLKFAGAVKEVFTTVKAAGGIMSALKAGIAALGGPISLVIAGVALLGFIIYKNWDKIKVFFKAAWKTVKGMGTIISGIFKAVVDGVVNLFKWLWNKLKTYFNNFGFLLLGPIGIFIKLGQLIYQNWDLIKEKLSSVWEYIKSIPEKVVETVLNFISTIGNFLVNPVNEVINGIKNLFIKLWDTAVQFFNNFGFLLLGPIGIFIKLGTVVHENWDLIKNKISSIFESFKNTIKNLAEQIKSFFANPFEYMSEAIAGAKEKVLDFARKIPGVKYLVGEKENVAKVNGSHANGLNYVPFDGYIAELHKGERVLTKDENESIFGSLRNRLHSATQSNQSENSSKETNVTYQINNTFNFTGVSEDTKNSIIEKLQESLNELQRQLEKIKEERETYARTSL